MPTVGVACDITKNKPGDRCAMGEEGVASCVSDHQMVVCRSGTYRFEPCRGSEGCENSRGRALCDKSMASVGEPCKEDGSKACAVGAQEVLTCQAGKMESLYRCLGPDGCQAKGKLNCDMSIADKGDPCDAQMEGAAACSPDKNSIVICKGGKFLEREECGSGKLCNPSGSTRCEKPAL